MSSSLLSPLCINFGSEPYPQLAHKLGSLDERERRKAFDQLVAMGQNATDVFMQVLQMPRKKAEVAEWDGTASTILAVKGLGGLKAKKAVPQLPMLKF